MNNIKDYLFHMNSDIIALTDDCLDKEKLEIYIQFLY
jgi:hypothetical protein